MWKDSETELDFLDYDYLIKALQSIILDDNLLPASIGVYGDWGSGKSSLMYMCKRRLEKLDPHVKCLVFNGWLFENYEDAKTAILGTILDEIGKEKKLSKKAKDLLKGLYESVDKFKLVKGALKYGTQFIVSGGIGTLAGLTVDKVLEKAKSMSEGIDCTAIKDAIAGELESKELRDDIRKFQEEFAQLLEATKISRLVVFVDELDRCRPDTILDTLEAIKLFMFKGKAAFVIGADERHISYAVKNKFKDIEGIQIDIGKEYLEKLIQYPIRIPRLNAEEVETYIACLLLQTELPPVDFERFIEKVVEAKHADFLKFNIMDVGTGFICETVTQDKITDSLSVARQLSEVLSSGLHGNPRQCKRFLNSLYMRLGMAEYRNRPLNRKILAKVMLLEYIKPALFNEVAKMAFNNTLERELKIAETGEKTEELLNLQTLKRWKDDEWFLNWCTIDPPLATTDLTVYFYFTRTSLDEKISRISALLSPQSQAILEKLLSKSEMHMKAAITDSKEISDSEAATILQVMFEKMSSGAKIEKEQFIAFVEFASSRDNLVTDTMEYFRNFTGEQIPLGAVANIGAFATKVNKKVEIIEIAQQWGNTKEDLKKAIETYLR